MLTEFPDLTTDIDLAPAYSFALEYNLAIVIAPVFETSASQEVAMSAKTSLSKIKRLNRQAPVMVYPAGIPTGRRQYNINSGY